MCQPDSMQQHDQELLEKIEAALAHVQTKQPEQGSVEELAALLINTAAQANPLFSQQLEAQLMTLSHSSSKHEQQASEGAGTRKILPLLQRPHRRTVSRHLWRPMAALVAVALVVWACLAVPAVRAATLQLLSLFQPQPADTMLASGLGDEALYAETVFFDLATVTRAEIENMAGFPVRMPESLPHNYHLQTALYNPVEQMVTLNFYNVEQSNDNIVLLQQPAASVDVTQFFKVGASATVEQVEVDNLPAEYVMGAWCTGSSKDKFVAWCGDLNIRNLRWYQADMAFALLAYGNPEVSDTLSREEMIDAAAQLTLDYDLADYLAPK